MLRLLIVALSVALAVASTQEGATATAAERAKLLLHKRLQNIYLVENTDIVVQYSLFNIGTAPALNVQLTDNGFNSEAFEIAGGQLQVKFDRIPPGSNITHTVVVKPKQFGYFNFTSAEVSYLPSEDSQEIQVGYTSEPGEGGIVPQREYDRKFSPHIFDWVIFAVLLVPVLVVPFLMWRKISSKYFISTKKSN